jgi:ATP dependent DNA ligase domain
LGPGYGAQSTFRAPQNCRTWFVSMPSLFPLINVNPFAQISQKSNITLVHVVSDDTHSIKHFSLDGPLVKVFDLLHLNGMSLLQKPLKYRKRNMRAYVKEIAGRIEFTTEFEAKTAKDIRQRMDEIMEARGEGLVIKHPDSEYVLNGRNKDWIKVRVRSMICGPKITFVYFSG